MADDRRQGRGSLLARHTLLLAALKDERTTKGDCQVRAVITKHADRSGACWPGVDKIARDMGIHRATVMRATEKLEQLGYLTIEKTEGRSNWYQLAKTSRTDATGKESATGRKDATGSGPPPVACAPRPPSHACAKTSRTDATLTQVLNSVHLTQGAAHADLDDQRRAEEQRRIQEEKEAKMRDGLRADYLVAVASHPKHARYMEREPLIRRHIEDLIGVSANQGSNGEAIDAAA